MQYTIPFVFHGKENSITVDYSQIADAHQAGFHILNLPFSPEASEGYRNYYDSYFISLMEQLGFEHQPHDTRHTCISLLAEAHVDQTMIKKIVGHKGAMSLTERVYTHPDIKALVDAINMI